MADIVEVTVEPGDWPMRRWTMRIVIGLAALVLIDTTLWFGAVAQMRSAWTNTLDQAR